MGGFEGSNGRRDGAIPSRGPEARGAKAEGSGGVGGLLSGRVPAGGRQAVLGESARVAPRAAQVSEDGGDDVGVENEGENLHFAAAAGTAQRIDLEDTFEKLGPALSERAQRRPIWRVVGGWGRDLGQRAGVGENAGSPPAGAPAHRVGAVLLFGMHP